MTVVCVPPSSATQATATLEVEQPQAGVPPPVPVVPTSRDAQGGGGPGSTTTPAVGQSKGARAGLPAITKAELTERNTLLAVASAAEAACSLPTQRSLGNVDEVSVLSHTIRAPGAHVPHWCLLLACLFVALGMRSQKRVAVA